MPNDKISASKRPEIIMKHAFYLICALIITGCNSHSSSDKTTAAEKLNILVGSYTAPGDTALRLLEFDPTTAELQVIAGTTEPENASYFTEADDGIIYGVSEDRQDKARAWALRLNKDAEKHVIFELIDTVATNGSAPCYISISPDGNFAVTANYDGETVTIMPIDKQTKALGAPVQYLHFSGKGPMAGRQDSSHPHCATFTPDSKCLIVNDLGSDKISMFDIATDSDSLVITESRREINLIPSSGPRHIVFDNDGQFAYLINELSDSVTVLSYSDHTLTPIQYIAANTTNAHGAADIHMAPDGKNIYASLRLSNDGIASFSVDPENGKVEYIGHTPTNAHPRNFLITPDGQYILVASRDAGSIEVFRRDTETGLLSPCSTLSGIKGVVCLKLIKGRSECN